MAFPTEREMLETVGELGVSLFDFYAMTWTEWCYYSNGLYKSKSKEWEHTRAITWMIYKVNSDPKKAEKNMLNWWKLPTDKNFKARAKRTKGKRLTKVQLQDFFNRMR